MNLKTKEEYLAFMMAGSFARGLCEMDTNPEKYREKFNVGYFNIEDDELFEQIAIKYMSKYENIAAKILDILEQYGENDESRKTYLKNFVSGKKKRLSLLILKLQNQNLNLNGKLKRKMFLMSMERICFTIFVSNTKNITFQVKKQMAKNLFILKIFPILNIFPTSLMKIRQN